MNNIEQQANNDNFEKPDRWREAILAERKRIKMEPLLKEALDSYEGDRFSALILGDASLVQSHLLLEKEDFEHVTDVDSSPMILDDDIVPINDSRLNRVLKQFDQYDPGENKFDLIYGKSIAFNPKDTIVALLQKLSSALNEKGLFFAEFGAEGDKYRKGISYTEEEIKENYKNANLEIVKITEFDEMVPGLINPGRAHDYLILAKKII